MIGIDIRVVQRSGDSRLVQEAFPEPLAPCERGRDNLQRDPPSEPLLLGQVHDAHAALAENRDSMRYPASSLPTKTSLLATRTTKPG